MIKIRLAQLDEFPFLNNLIALSARELSRDDYSSAEIDGAVHYGFGVDIELVLDKSYYVIEKDGEIAGCGGWSRRKTLFGGNQFAGRETVAYLNPEHDAAKIRAFFIHPRFARQGLGRMLLTHCEQQANLHGFNTLEMMATLPGVKLYRNSAYKVVRDEVIELPNKISLRFVRMSKNLNKLQVRLND